jgi:hypothetical protein
VQAKRVTSRRTLWRVAALGEDVINVHTVLGGMPADAIEQATIQVVHGGELGFPLGGEEGS